MEPFYYQPRQGQKVASIGKRGPILRLTNYGVRYTFPRETLCCRVAAS